MKSIIINSLLNVITVYLYFIVLVFFVSIMVGIYYSVSHITFSLVLFVVIVAGVFAFKKLL